MHLGSVGVSLLLAVLVVRIAGVVLDDVQDAGTLDDGVGTLLTHLDNVLLRDTSGKASGIVLLQRVCA